MRFLVYVLCGVLLAPTVWASDTAPSTKNGQVNTEEFHILPAYLPDHKIGESGPLVMDTTERKTTRYSSVDAVNSAINVVAVSNINNDMHTNGKAWMKRTTVALSFQKDWKPLYSVETVQPIGHYDDQSHQVWFTQGSVARAADVGTTLNSAYGKIMFRLAGADMAWYGGKHKLDTESTVRSKMLETVKRKNML